MSCLWLKPERAAAVLQPRSGAVFDKQRGRSSICVNGLENG